MRNFPLGASVSFASCAKAGKAVAISVAASITTIQGLMESSAISKRHDDLAEMLVGFHVRERLADIVEGEHLVDRQWQFARFHRRPQVLACLLEYLPDFIDRAGSEGDADIVDTARRMQVGVEGRMGAGEAG